MKPAPFEYHAPESVADAVGLLTEHGDEAKALAGGQSLVPMLALRLARFEHLVDLNRVTSLAGIAGDGSTARTPGTAAASIVSTPSMRARANGLRTKQAWSIPGHMTSSTNVPVPVTRRGSSTRPIPAPA